MPVRVFAPAKVNLTLHVVGQRPDGYHLLDTLVAFADVGDHLFMERANESSLSVSGPEESGVPTDDTNLAMRARALMMPQQDVAMRLEKRLPAASGIGGGSADAAAAVRGALALMDRAAQDLLARGPDILVETRLKPLLELGADVPMCFYPRPLRARGIGEEITFVDMPPLAAILVNPRVAVSTPNVFRALPQRDNAPMPDPLPQFTDRDALVDWLGAQRNDMETAAISLVPEIGAVLHAVRDMTGCDLTRMSGSGATVFGLFSHKDLADEAAAALERRYPQWWVKSCILGDQVAAAMPARATASMLS